MRRTLFRGEVSTYIGFIPPLYIAYLMPAIAAFWIAYREENGGIEIKTIYQEQLRADLFSGFLSLGGFMLAAMTFTIMKLKEAFCDSEEYKRLLDDDRVIGVTHADPYRPLRQLTQLFAAAIAMCLTTALLQVTIGFIDSQPAVALCLSTATLASVTLFHCLTCSYSNLMDTLRPPLAPKNEQSAAHQ